MTAEYSMLPGPTGSAAAGTSQAETLPRSAEIQRLVGRALRAAVDLKKLGARTITIDCDVLQGDGGTRTASVTGGFVALSYACWKLVEEGVIPEMPITTCVAAVSAGIVDDVPMLDLCYEEDSSAMVDLNCVMNHEGEIIELQGTGEAGPSPLPSSGSWWTCAPRASGRSRPSRKPCWKEGTHESRFSQP